MDNSTYLYILLVALLIAAAVVFLLTRRHAEPPASGLVEPDDAGQLADDRASFQATAAEALIEPGTTIPPEAVAPPIGLAGDALAPPAPIEKEFAAAAGPPDELTRLKGLGPKAAARLNELGITRYDQLAALTPERLAAVDAQMGAFRGRIARDRWVEQAGHLAAGDTAGFEAKFGKLGG